MAVKKKTASRKSAAAPKKAAKAAVKASKAKTRVKKKPAATEAGPVAAKAPGKGKAPGATPRRAYKRSPAKLLIGDTAVGVDGADAVNGVDGYFDKAGGWQAEAMRKIHAIVVDAAGGVKHGIKWAQPVYEKYGPLAFLRSAKNHVTLGFWRGAEMIAPKGLLEGAGDKMKHLKIKSVSGIPGAVVDLVRQAVKLNEKNGDPTRKRG